MADPWAEFRRPAVPTTAEPAAAPAIDPWAEFRAVPTASVAAPTGGVNVTIRPQDQAKDSVAPVAKTAAAAPPSAAGQVAEYADHTAAVAAREGVRGFSQLVGLPFDLAQSGLEFLGLPEGGARPSGLIDRAINAPAELIGALTGTNANPQPQDAFQRIVGRAGKEIGATAVPLGAALGAASRLGAEGVKAAGPLTKYLVEPALKNPTGLISREAGYATAAGLGAGTANEIAGNEQNGDNFWSDIAGSIAGVTAAGVGQRTAGALYGLGAGALGSPRFVDDVVQEEVAGRLVNSSTQMAEQAAANGGLVTDTTPLVNALRGRAEVEEVIPGYQANIGDRTRDPGLLAFSFDQDAARGGARNARQINNETAVNARLAGLDPNGDPAQFRAAVQSGRDQRIAQADSIADMFGGEMAATGQRLVPATIAEARGATVRGSVEEAERAARDIERAAYEGIEGTVAPAPLAERFARITESLPEAYRDLAPANLAAIPARLGDEAALTEMNALRSRLTTEARNAVSGPQPDSNRARILNQYVTALDSYVDEAVDPDTLQQLTGARATSRNANERFNRPNDPLAAVLSRREGRPDVQDSAVTGRFVQPDTGQASNIDRLLTETDTTGGAAATRSAIRDEILSDVQRRGLADRPEQLRTYLDQYGTVFSRFPDLRAELDRAGSVSELGTSARKIADETRRDLTTPGRSATASYLKYDDTGTVEAVRTVTASPQPREAARELLEAAGNTPEARQNARGALWEVVKTKLYSANSQTGERRVNPRLLRDMFNDPKTTAVADELWADNPEDLTDIKKVFNVLAGAEGSVRAGTPGATSTSRTLGGGLDNPISPASLSASLRAVNQGRASPTVTGIEIASRWLRGRSAQVQKNAIDALASQVVNNPGMAADLLEKFNPADYAAKRRSITQKYGVRATQIINLLDEANGQDDTRDAVMGDD